jgi:hypothetical protein
MNYFIGTLQCVWAGGCGRTPWPRGTTPVVDPIWRPAQQLIRVVWSFCWCNNSSALKIECGWVAAPTETSCDRDEFLLMCLYLCCETLLQTNGGETFSRGAAEATGYRPASKYGSWHTN